MRASMRAVLAFLLAAALAGPAFAARNLLSEASAPDDCRDDGDCGRSQVCIRGLCSHLKDDGEVCRRDAECRSGTCQKRWWPSGAVCVTTCSVDDECPSSRPICNPTSSETTFLPFSRGGGSGGMAVLVKPATDLKSVAAGVTEIKPLAVEDQEEEGEGMTGGDAEDKDDEDDDEDDDEEEEDDEDDDDEDDDDDDDEDDEDDDHEEPWRFRDRDHDRDDDRNHDHEQDRDHDDGPRDFHRGRGNEHGHGNGRFHGMMDEQMEQHTGEHMDGHMDEQMQEHMGDHMRGRMAIGAGSAARASLAAERGMAAGSAMTAGAATTAMGGADMMAGGAGADMMAGSGMMSGVDMAEMMGDSAAQQTANTKDCGKVAGRKQQSRRRHLGEEEQKEEAGETSVEGDKKDGKKKKPDAPATGVCVQCLKDKDCGDGYYCERAFKSTAHTCMKLGKSCSAFADCGMGEYCDATYKRCRPYLLGGLLRTLATATAAGQA